MFNLLEMPLVLGAVAFLAGYVLAKLGSLLGRRRRPKAPGEMSERDHRLRSVGAELRVAQRKLEESEKAEKDWKIERGELTAEIEALRDEAATHEVQLQDLRGQLVDECSKTQTLRSELSSRAEESIRAQVALRDMETELSLAQVGSEVVRNEIDRLAAEREELTGRLDSLKQQLDEEEAQDEPRSRPMAADLALDC
jgi:chromosome segregation ATPase